MLKCRQAETCRMGEPQTRPTPNIATRKSKNYLMNYKWATGLFQASHGKIKIINKKLDENQPHTIMTWRLRTMPTHNSAIPKLGFGLLLLSQLDANRGLGQRSHKRHPKLFWSHYLKLRHLGAYIVFPRLREKGDTPSVANHQKDGLPVMAQVMQEIGWFNEQ